MYNKNGNIGASVPDNKQLSRLLRIKVLFLLAAIGLSGSVAAQTSSPNARISLDLQNVPLKEVFARIEDQSNYIFVYYDSILDASRRVSISVSDQPVGNVLEVLFAGTENTWKLSGRQIVIGKAAAAGKAEKQTPLRVMGSVKDTNGEPLIGVTVFVKERPSVGTATDINGNYLIDVQTDDVLEFSYVGYKTQDVAVAGRGLLDIVLEQNDAILDAVEVVGYGVQKKISVKEARRLITLIEDIIKLSKLDEESVELEKEDVDLYELTREIVSRLSPQAAQKNIRIELSGESVHYHGIRQILDEMVYNVCENAVKYNYENGKVSVWAGNTLNGPKISVSDTGIGIPKEHQERIFERFYRVDKSHSKERGGTGLGLSIVKHGALLHGAKVSVESEEGRGTKISMQFPRICQK